MTVHCFAIKKSRSESSGGRGSWIKRRLASTSSLLRGNCAGQKDAHARMARVRLGWGCWTPAIWDGWRNCSPCCPNCVAGWGLLGRLSGDTEGKKQRGREPQRPSGREGKEAHAPLLVTSADRCSQYPQLWRVGSGEQNLRSLGTLGKRCRAFFLKLSKGLKWIVVLVGFSLSPASFPPLRDLLPSAPWGQGPDEGGEGWSQNDPERS